MTEQKFPWKVAWITGASGAICGEVAKRLAAAGVKVGATARPSEKLDALAASSANIKAFPADALQPYALKVCARNVESELGAIDLAHRVPGRRPVVELEGEVGQRPGHDRPGEGGRHPSLEVVGDRSLPPADEEGLEGGAIGPGHERGLLDVEAALGQHARDRSEQPGPVTADHPDLQWVGQALPLVAVARLESPRLHRSPPTFPLPANLDQDAAVGCQVFVVD